MKVRIPKYAQIKQDILDDIKSGNLKPGDRVDGESLLKSKYDVSAITVRKAFTDLINDGYLTGVQGVGTFVTKKRMNRSLTSISFSDELLQQGYHIDMHVDRIEEVTHAEAAEIFELPSDTPLTKVSRVRLANEEPVAYQSSFVPASLLTPQQAEAILENGSFYATLATVHIDPVWVSENYSVRAVKNRHIAELMTVRAGTDTFFVKRTAYDDSDRVVEYAETYFNKDWYSVTVNIKV